MTEIQHKIGRYELRCEIGRGAMGIVYEARDPLLERTVAVKTIKAAAASAEELALFEQRFLAEARIAAGLSHPGIVVVHDVGQDAETGQLFIAMEHLEGRALSEILRPGVALPWREALQLTGRIAEALHYAHARGVVHRDVKPANIMVAASGEPKIMDFGIAKAQTAQFKLTIAGQSVGTPLYASPEQVLGQPVDGRSDLFSLGAIAYSLLTGRAAFAAPNLTGVIANVIGYDPAPPSSLVPDLPPEVDQVVARALAKDPAARHPDGAAFAAEIADLLAGVPLRAATADRAGPVETRSPQRRELPDLRRLAELASRRYGDQALDLEAELAALVEPGVEERTQPLAAPGPAPAEPSSAPVAARPIAPQPMAAHRAARRRLGLVIAALAVAGALLTARSLMLSGQQASPTTPAASRRAAREKAESRPAKAPVAAESRSTKAPAASVREPVRAPGRLSILFESSPRSASVRVWVDRKVVSVQHWEDPSEERTRLLRFRAGTDTLQLAPRGHDVEVEVAWDGKRSRERIWGEVETGATRRLRVKLGGLLKKKISLEWD